MWLAFMILRIVLTVAPLVFGIDKFFNILTYWPQYLAPVVNGMAPLKGQPFMYVVGAVEIMLGILVLILPRYGAVFLVGWLGFIILNLFLVADYYDVALRDFGLLAAALALFALSFHRVGGGVEGDQERDHVRHRARTW